MVFEMLRDMLGEALGCDEAEITLRSELRDDLGLSEAELQNVVDALSGELGFHYEPEALEELNTVSQLVTYISSLL